MNFSGKRDDGSKAATDSQGNPLSAFFFGQSSMAKTFLASENGAVKVEATDEELKSFAALGCGMQTGAGAILNVLNPPINSSIAVFGAGSVGLAACLAAKLTKPKHLIVIDNTPAKFDLMPEDIVTHTVCSEGLKEGQVAEKLEEITQGRGVDYVLDCAGVGQLLTDSHTALASRGTLLTVGGGPSSVSIDLTAQLTKGATYRGTHQGDSVPATFIPLMIDLWRQGKFPFDKLLTFYKFDELEKALADLKQGKVIKPVMVASRD